MQTLSGLSGRLSQRAQRESVCDFTLPPGGPAKRGAGVTYSAARLKVQVGDRDGVLVNFLSRDFHLQHRVCGIATICRMFASS